MKITIINKSSNRKPAGFCAEMVDEPPMNIKK